MAIQSTAWRQILLLLSALVCCGCGGKAESPPAASEGVVQSSPASPAVPPAAITEGHTNVDRSLPAEVPQTQPDEPKREPRGVPVVETPAQIPEVPIVTEAGPAVDDVPQPVAAGPTPADTLAWLRQLDQQKFQAPRFRAVADVADVARISGLRLGGHVKPDNKHAHYSAEELQHLKNMPALRVLDLVEGEVDNEGLVELVRYQQLTHLIITDAPITDESVKLIAKLAGLTHLSLAFPAGWNQPPPKITGAALAHLAPLKKLEYLDLGGTQVNDAGLVHLQQLPALKELRLMNAPISGAAVPTLAKLQQLKVLRLKPGGQTQMTAADVARLRQQLPNCTILDKGEPYPGGFGQGEFVKLIAGTVPASAPGEAVAVNVPSSEPPMETSQNAPASRAGKSSLAAEIKALQIPPAWLASVTTNYDTSKPWKESRLEIRRLMGVNQESARREAVKLTWIYYEREPDTVASEFPLNLFLAGEPVWSIVAHEEYIRKALPERPTHSYLCLAALYIECGEFEKAKATLDAALQKLPPPPWTITRTAEVNNSLGDLYVAWGNTALARRHYAEAIRLYPTSNPAYGGHLIKSNVEKIQAKIDLLSMRSLSGARLQDGSYQQKTQGYSGEIDQTVIVRQGRIADIQIRHQEKIDQNACVLIPQRIIAAQSLQVDGVSGATVTKDAIVAGTLQALRKAGLK